VLHQGLAELNTPRMLQLSYDRKSWNTACSLVQAMVLDDANVALGSVKRLRRIRNVENTGVFLFA